MKIWALVQYNYDDNKGGVIGVFRSQELAKIYLDKLEERDKALGICDYGYYIENPIELDSLIDEDPKTFLDQDTKKIVFLEKLKADDFNLINALLEQDRDAYEHINVFCLISVNSERELEYLLREHNIIRDREFYIKSFRNKYKGTLLESGKVLVKKSKVDCVKLSDGKEVLFTQSSNVLWPKITEKVDLK